MRGLPRSRRAAFALLGLSLVTALGACSTTTVAQPAVSPSSTAASPQPAEPTGTVPSSVDERLHDLIAKIEQNRQKGADIPGYAGVSIDAKHRALDLWWVGEPPEYVRRLITATPDDLVVRLHAAEYDIATMIPAVEKLMARYPIIHAASPEFDGSGIEVQTTAKGRRSLPNAARLAEQVGMPVRVVISAPPVPA